EQSPEHQVAAVAQLALAGREQHVAGQIDHLDALVAEATTLPGRARLLVGLDRPQHDEEDHHVGHEVDVDDLPGIEAAPRARLTRPLCAPLHSCTLMTASPWNTTARPRQRASKS